MMKESVKDLASLALRESERVGADYAEARIQGGVGYGFMLKNGEPQPSMVEDSLGIGVRVICGGALGFGATNLLDRQSVKGLAAKTVRMAVASRSLVKNPIKLDRSRAVRQKVFAPQKESIEGADASWLKSLLLEIDGRIEGGGKKGDGSVKIPN